MNKLNLFSKLAIASVVGVTATTIATAPAQASVGALGFSNGTSNFFSEGINNDDQESFTVDFVGVLFEDVVTEVDGASGKFAPFFDSFPQIVDLLDTPSSEFTYVGPFDGTDAFIYQNEDDLVWEFDPDGDNTAEIILTYGAESQFLGAFDVDPNGQIDGIGFEELVIEDATVFIEGEGLFDLDPDEDGFINGIDLVFEDIPETTIGGEYGGSVSVDKVGVPEPASILGLLAVGGLGLGLKRKKQ